MGPDRRRVRALVSGRVQGVGFRWFVAERARAAGLGGWVRNLDDGGVEFEAEGDPVAVDRLLAAVRRGPTSARVADVLVTDAPPSSDPPARVDFEIRHW